MLKTFVFLATVWSGNVPTVYVLDHGLSGEDCIAAMESGAVAVVDNGKRIDLSGAVLSCEFDNGN